MRPWKVHDSSRRQDLFLLRLLFQFVLSQSLWFLLQMLPIVRSSAAVAPATNSGSWTNSNDVRICFHFSTFRPGDISLDDTLCMQCDSSCWLRIRHYSYIPRSMINCCTFCRKMTANKSEKTSNYSSADIANLGLKLEGRIGLKLSITDRERSDHHHLLYHPIDGTIYNN